MNTHFNNAAPPCCENDIFISYAHIDDQSLREGDPGWVSKFHRALEVRISQLLGKKPKIWRDPKLQGNDVFGDEIFQQIPEAALLVSILSPRYVRSEWCTRELREFSRAFEKSGGPRVANKTRIFKILKTPVPREQHPTELQQALGYEFFTTDPETGRKRELDQAPGSENERQYWAKLDDLAHDISEMLDRLKSCQAAAPSPARPPASEKPTIYLAQTTFDLAEEYESVKRHLQRQGHTVLPDRPLPMLHSGCESLVREDLSRCRMSIHLMGRNYGFVPEGTARSVVELQNRLAIERSQETDLLRLVWLPPGLQVKDERQRTFIEQLHSDAGMQRGADVLETPLEDLKTVIQQKLNPPERAVPHQPKEVSPEEEEDFTLIYLISDQRDAGATADLEDYLYDRGCEVILPVFEGDEAQVRQDHEDNLRSCEAVIIYYGQGNELWMRKQLRELKKSAALGRSKPFAAKAICVTPPESPHKKRLRSHEALIIRQDEDFRPAIVQPFLDLIEQRKTEVAKCRKIVA